LRGDAFVEGERPDDVLDGRDVGSTEATEPRGLRPVDPGRGDPWSKAAAGPADGTAVRVNERTLSASGTGRSGSAEDSLRASSFLSKDVERGVAEGSITDGAGTVGVLPRADELEVGRDALRTTGSGENTVSRDRGRDPDDAGSTRGRDITITAQAPALVIVKYCPSLQARSCLIINMTRSVNSSELPGFLLGTSWTVRIAMVQRKKNIK